MDAFCFTSSCSWQYHDYKGTPTLEVNLYLIKAPGSRDNPDNTQLISTPIPLV